MNRTQQLRFACGIFVVIRLLAIATACFAHGEMEIRIAAVTQQIQCATTSVAELFLERGDLYRQHQDWLAAAADYAHAAKLNPTLPTISLHKAMLMADTGRLSEAEHLFTAAIDSNPQKGDALIGRARVRLKLGNRKGAIDDFQLGMQSCSKPDAEVFLEFARTLAAEGQSTTALQVIDQGIVRVGPTPLLEDYGVELELRKSDFESAVKRVDVVLANAQRKEKWLAQRGEILMRAQRFAEARRSLIACLRAIDGLPPRLRESKDITSLIEAVRKSLATIGPNVVSTAKD